MCLCVECVEDVLYVCRDKKIRGSNDPLWFYLYLRFLRAGRYFSKSGLFAQNSLTR